MYNRSDELYLLGHTLRQFFHLLVPPALDTETHEPFLEFCCSIFRAHTLETCKIHSLLAHLHLTVKSSLLGKITDLFYIVLSDGSAIKKHLTTVRNSYSVYDTDQGRLSGTVRA